MIDLPSGTLDVIQRRLRQGAPAVDRTPEHFAAGKEDSGEVLRHELNNPLTSIPGNSELLLAEIRRKGDGKPPPGAQQRVETIAALAVRLRETVRRLSVEWGSAPSHGALNLALSVLV